MANHGKDTNGSQFYILYKSARHLDFKHAVFGTVVGGFETLSAFEAVSTDDEDRPREEIRITGALWLYWSHVMESMLSALCGIQTIDYIVANVCCLMQERRLQVVLFIRIHTVTSSKQKN